MFVWGPAARFISRAFLAFSTNERAGWRRPINAVIRSRIAITPPLSAPTMAAILVVVVDALIRLPLTLLLGCSTRAVPAAVLDALAIEAVIHAGSVASGLGSLVPLLRRGRMQALVDRHIAFHLVASIVVVPCGHGFSISLGAAAAET
jgi:hypothetical protein